MHPLIVPLILFVGGIYFLVRNIRLLKDKSELETYLATSPTGKAWVSRFGQEKTADLSKKYFLPLGAVVAVVMIGLGGWSLFHLLPSYI